MVGTEVATSTRPAVATFLPPQPTPPSVKFGKEVTWPRIETDTAQWTDLHRGLPTMVRGMSGAVNHVNGMPREKGGRTQRVLSGAIKKQSSKPLESEIAKKLKDTMMRRPSTKGIHANNHKHPRRSHRPVQAKPQKAARVEREITGKTIADTEMQVSILKDKLRLLHKLHGRQAKAGNPSAASTLNQLEAMENEKRGLEEDIKAMRMSLPKA